MAESRFQWACGLASSWPHVLLPMKALSDWQGIDYATANNLIGKHGLALVAVGNDVGSF